MSTRKKQPAVKSVTPEEYSKFVAVYERALEHVLTSIGDYKKENEMNGQEVHLSEPLYRIKTFESIIKKCQAKTGQASIDINAIKNNISDIAGIRLIVKYEDEIFKVADALNTRLRLNVVTVKDYVNNPKPSGYRSLHLIVQREIYFDGKTYTIPVEIQIRTTAMDLWAGDEHLLQYKNDNPCPEAKDYFDEIAKLLIEYDAMKMKLRDFNKNPPT